MNKKLTVKIEKQLIKLRSMEASNDLSNSICFEESTKEGNNMSPDKAKSVNNLEKSQVVPTRLGQPPMLQASINNEENVFLQKKYDELKIKFDEANVIHQEEKQKYSVQYENIEKVCHAFKNKSERYKG